MGALMNSNEIIMVENCTAVILAGGKSRRMGEDKAKVVFRGKTLLDRAIANLEPLFANIVVSVHHPLPIKLPQVVDAGGGPMAGLVAALEYVRTDWIFAIGVDMPFIVPAVLKHMAAEREGRDAVLAEVEGYLQPMPAFYARSSCLPAMQSRIAQGRRSLMRLMPLLNTAVLTEKDLRLLDPDLRSFVDFDTPEDMAAFGGK